MTLKTMAQSVGGVASGAQTYCDTLNSGFVSITGYTGNVTTWQFSTNGGTTWTNNGNAFSSQSYFNLKQSTCYRAVVQNGAFPPDTSTIVCITIYLPSVGGTILGGGQFCGGSGSGSLNLINNIGAVSYWQFSINNGSTWTNIANSTTTLAYSNITQNTLYRAIVKNSSFCINDTSALGVFSIFPTTVAGNLSSAGTNSVCYGVNSNTISLSGNVGNVLNWLNSTDNGVTWNSIPNTTTSHITTNITESTLYKAVVQSAICSIDTTPSLNIFVINPFPVNAGNDTTISQGQSVALSGTGVGSPIWSPSANLNAASIYTPIATPDITTYYILSVTDINSCVNSDTVLITVIPIEFEGIISNVFSPNGDGINDSWYIENIKYYPNNEVNVYNIYGQLVFTAKPYNNDWQGTYNGASLPDGTYFYTLNIDETSPVLKGSIDILRNK
jgi:gliding motility-associated-like protein